MRDYSVRLKTKGLESRSILITPESKLISMKVCRDLQGLYDSSGNNSLENREIGVRREEDC